MAGGQGLHHSRVRDGLSIVVLLLGSLLLLAAGMNGFLWFDTRAWWRFPARFGVFALGMTLIILHVMTWAKRHRNTLVPAPTPRKRHLWLFRWSWWLLKAFGRVLRWLLGRLTRALAALWTKALDGLVGPLTPKAEAERPTSEVGLAARQLLEKELSEFLPLTARAMTQLVRTLTSPQADRRGISEKQTLRGATMDFEVTLDLAPGATVHLEKESPSAPAVGPTRRLPLLPARFRHDPTVVSIPEEKRDDDLRVVLLARPLKWDHYGRVAATADGQRLLVLSRTKSLALLYAACRWPLFAPLHKLPIEQRDELQNKLATLLLLDPVPEQPTVPGEPVLTKEKLLATARQGLLAELAEKTGLDQPGFEEQRGILESLLYRATARRPYFAVVPSTEPLRAVTYSFTTRVEQGPLPEEIDWWRRKKDRIRNQLQLPSKFVAFSLARSRATDAYVADVGLPDGLYVDEAYLMSGDTVLTPFPRDVVRPGYVSRTDLNGRSDIRVATWQVRQAQDVMEPRLLVRMIETPPGSVFTAVLVASAVLLSIWLTGIVTGLNLPSNGHGVGGAPLGIVALATTLPGLLSSWWGIAFTRTAGVFRSLTGLISLSVSAGLSLLTLMLYLARFAVGRGVDASMSARPGEHTIYLIRDWISFGLFFLSLVNVGFVLGLFISRIWRYQSMKTAVGNAERSALR